jgi:hypothetical protein
LQRASGLAEQLQLVVGAQHALRGADVYLLLLLHVVCAAAHQAEGPAAKLGAAWLF